MKMTITLLFLIFAYQSSYARKVIVHSLDEKNDLSKLDSLTFEKHEGLPHGPKNSSLISVENQNKVFSEAKLENEVKSFDQLDRDMLILIVKKENLAAAAKKYPKIPKEKLKMLKALVQEKK